MLTEINGSRGGNQAFFSGIYDRTNCSPKWERKFRGRHSTPEAWATFTAMLEEGKRHRARTGQSLMVGGLTAIRKLVERI